MRILGILMTTMFLSVAAQAATINLTDGRQVQGDIVSQDSKSVQVNVDGVSMTYYADEIKDIDGQPLGSNASASASAPQSATPPAAIPAAVPNETDNTTNQTAVNTSAGGIDPDKRELILKFINVFGTRRALENNFQLMLQQIEKDKPDEAEKIRDRVKVDEIIERLLPIYDRNFTSDDLKSFIAFYSSPEGRKLITTIPELMKESVQESVKYMEEKFPEVKQDQAQ